MFHEGHDYLFVSIVYARMNESFNIGSEALSRSRLKIAQTDVHCGYCGIFFFRCLLHIFWTLNISDSHVSKHSVGPWLDQPMEGRRWRVQSGMNQLAEQLLIGCKSFLFILSHSTWNVAESRCSKSSFFSMCVPHRTTFSEAERLSATKRIKRHWKLFCFALSLSTWNVTQSRTGNGVSHRWPSWTNHWSTIKHESVVKTRQNPWKKNETCTIMGSPGKMHCR